MNNPYERKASIERNTKETQISVTVNLDGTGVVEADTGLPFLEHMLDQIARHGLIDIQVKAGTMASSPGPNPDAARDKCNPLVHEVTAMECLAFVKFDHFSSNSLTFGPCTNHPDSNGSRTELISASVRFVLAIGIFIFRKKM